MKTTETKKRKRTVSIDLEGFANLFSDFATFVIKGSGIFSHTGFMQALEAFPTEKLSGKKASNPAENMDAIVKHLGWIWDEPNFYRDKKDFLSNCFVNYQAFIKSELIDTAIFEPSDKVKKLVGMSKAIDISDFKAIKSFMKKLRKPLQDVALDSKQKKQYKVKSLESSSERPDLIKSRKKLNTTLEIYLEK